MGSEERKAGLSFDHDLTAGGICGGDERPTGGFPEEGSGAPQDDPNRVGQDVYDDEEVGGPNTICSR